MPWWASPGIEPKWFVLALVVGSCALFCVSVEGHWRPRPFSKFLLLMNHVVLFKLYLSFAADHNFAKPVLNE